MSDLSKALNNLYEKSHNVTREEAIQDQFMLRRWVSMESNIFAANLANKMGIPSWTSEVIMFHAIKPTKKPFIKYIKKDSTKITKDIQATMQAEKCNEIHAEQILQIREGR